jgi:hypothetical protein
MALVINAAYRKYQPTATGNRFISQQGEPLLVPSNE